MKKNTHFQIGNTPIIKLDKAIPKDYADVYIKLEEFNNGGSIKSRVALQMIRNAENIGVLIPNSGQTIIEPTGGNTGIALSMISALRGYKTVLVMPDNYSLDKAKIMRTYGATVIYSDSKKGNNSHLVAVNELLNENKDYIFLDQFSNISNIEAQYQTGDEIVKIFNSIDCFVSGIGSGGTITGVGKRIKEKFPLCKIFGVQPQGCDTYKGIGVSHMIEGIGVGIIPPLLDFSLLDDIYSITYDEVIQCIKKLAKIEGILVGLSSGANICVSIKIAQRLGKGKTIITISPDGGRNYLHHFDSD